MNSIKSKFHKLKASRLFSVSPNGKFYVSALGANDCSVGLFDLETHELITHFPHNAFLTCCTVYNSSQGLRIVAGYADGTIRIWDPEAPQAVPLLLQGHEYGDVNCCTIYNSPTGLCLATGGGDKTVRIWDLEHPLTAPRILQHSAEVIYCAIYNTPQGPFIVTLGKYEKILRIWNPAMPQAAIQILRDPKLHSWIWCCCTYETKDGWRIVTGSEDGKLRIWDPAQPQVAPICLSTSNSGKFTDEGNKIFSCAVYPSMQGLRIVSCHRNGVLRIWDPAQPQAAPQTIGEYARDECGYLRIVEHCVVYTSLQGIRIAFGSANNSLWVWDPNSPRTAPQFLQGDGRNVSACVIDSSSQGVRIILGGWDKSLRIWQLATPQPPLQYLRGHTDTITCCNIYYTAQKLRIVSGSGSQDCTLRIWDPDMPYAALQVLQGHTGYITCCTTYHDGEDVRIVSASDDKTVRIWDPNVPIALQVLRGHTSRVECCAAYVGRDGFIYIVSGGTDGTLRIWNLAQPQAEPRILRGHTSCVSYCVVYTSPQGTRIISGGGESGCEKDYTLRVWDPEHPQAMPLILQGHTAHISCCTICIDPLTQENYLISGSTNGDIIIWNLTTMTIAHQYNVPAEPKACFFLPEANQQKTIYLITVMENGYLHSYPLHKEPTRSLTKIALKVALQPLAMARHLQNAEEASDAQKRLAYFKHFQENYSQSPIGAYSANRLLNVEKDYAASHPNLLCAHCDTLEFLCSCPRMSI